MTSSINASVEVTGVATAKADINANWAAAKAEIEALQGNFAGGVSTDNAIARFNGVAGAIQNSGITIDDNGKLVTVASSATSAGLYLAPGSAPSSPANGDLWLTSTGLDAQIGGSTVPIGSFTQAGTSPVTRTPQNKDRDTLDIADFCSSSLMTAGGDITACLTNAIAQAMATGRCLLFPATPTGVDWHVGNITIGDGTGAVASTINNLCMRGAGSAGLYGLYGTYLKYNGTASGTMFTVNGPFNDLQISGFNLNGLSSAGRLIQLNAVRFSKLHDIYGSSFTVKGLDIEGRAASSANNLMLELSYLYFTTSTANAISLNLDGVLANSTDTWLSTVSNCRFESTGTGGIAVRLGYSDNVLFNQLHAVTSGNAPTDLSATLHSSTTVDVTTTGLAAGMYVNYAAGIPAGTTIASITDGTHLELSQAATVSGAVTVTFVKGAGVMFDASTSGTGGNAFPKGHLFVKSAIDNTATIEDATHTISPNNFVDFGTTDSEVIPTHKNLRGTTDNGGRFWNGTSQVPDNVALTYCGKNYLGDGETNFWNAPSTATVSFAWHQITGAGTQTSLMFLYPSGELNPQGNVNIPAGKIYKINGSQITCSALSGVAASCSTDTTNAANISSGLLAVARGGTGIGSGTSGGVPYYSGSTTIASSGALTQYGVVYGGGAGATPAATAAGSAGQVLTSNASSAPTYQAVPQILTLAANLSVAAGGTKYFTSVGNGSPGVITGIAPVSGTFDKLYAQVNIAPGGTETFVFTWRVNGSDTGLTCTITGVATSCNDTTHTASITAGQTYELKVVASGAAATTIPFGGIRFSAP